MTIAAFALIVVAVTVMVFVHIRTQRRLEQSLIDRHKALDKQAKVFVRRLEVVRRVAAQAVDHSRELQAHARELHEQTETLIRDGR